MKPFESIESELSDFEIPSLDVDPDRTHGTRGGKGILNLRGRVCGVKE